LITATAIERLPEVGPGADLAALLRPHVADGDVLVVAHKVVSKAEGRVVALDDVVPGERARALGAEHGKDPRHLQVILDETDEIVRSRPGVLICRTHHGFVCANAGVDTSNAPHGAVVLLPRDPDASARRLRAGLAVRCGVVIADSFGRAWRIGQSDVAIGSAGITVLDDWRGRTDRTGMALQATLIAVADQAAAAADLARAGKDAGHPAVVVAGLEQHVLDEDGPGAAALIRTRGEDLFL
jgi:coenzyme F420-0:L-glutamate ligase / coenzyme F420-1:gamma-L-glutamate ligase